MKCKPNSKNTKWKDNWNQYQRKLKAEFLPGKTGLSSPEIFQWIGDRCSLASDEVEAATTSQSIPWVG